MDPGLRRADIVERSAAAANTLGSSPRVTSGGGPGSEAKPGPHGQLFFCDIRGDADALSEGGFHELVEIAIQHH